MTQTSTQTTTQTPTLVDLGKGLVRVSSLKSTDLTRSPSASSKSSKSNKSTKPAPTTMWTSPSTAPRCLEVQFEDAFLRLVHDRPEPKPATGQFGSWNKEWPVFWEGAGLGAF